MADALATREQNRPENLLARKGYIVYEGNFKIPPVQTAIVTNVSTLTFFSYTASLRDVDPASVYLKIFEESRDLLGITYHKEQQRIYPAGFSRFTNKIEEVTYSYTFKDLPKGRIYYEWQEKKRYLLMRGFHDVKYSVKHK